MAKIKIKKLLANRVMVNPKTLDETTKAGIILPGNLNKEMQGYGVIMMIGEEVYHHTEDVKLVVGQNVIYGKMAGFEMDYEDGVVKILRDSDISAILEQPKKED